MPNNETLLEEIRDQYEAMHRYWRPVFDEGDIDMRYISGDPWDPEERLKRKNKRPCLSPDQLGQYVNQLVNEVKQNPRAIKLTPAGQEATDDLAERRAELIRGIEYRSNAQSAYTWGFQNAVQRSYGSWRVTAKYVSDSKFDQELIVDRILNPSSVLLDPYAQKQDFSDMKRAFIVNFMSKERFEKQYPDAEVKSFGTDWVELAPGWITDKGVQVGEYWRVETKRKKLYKLPDGQISEKLPPGVKAVKERNAVSQKVRQYITNGIEILDTVDWPGEFIPIVPCFGRELWMQDGVTTKRLFLSHIRLARDMQMLYAFLRTQEAEEAKLSPRVPFIVAEGQLEGHERDWVDSINDPKGFLYYKTKTDATGDQLLPPPTRVPFQPNFLAYSAAAEDTRRDIQSAMGTTSLPTAAQRQNEKSGIALKQIEQQMSKGAYHFIDNYEVALQCTGRIINPLLKAYYNGPRDVPAQKADKTYFMMRVNDQAYVNPKNKKAEFIDLSKGEYDVTISTGSSFESQREEANQFVDTLVANLKNLPVPPPVATKLLALALRLKTLGPIGDEMAELLDPKQQGQEEIPPQVQEMLQKLQQETQALNAYAKELEGKVQELTQEKQAKAADNASKEKIANLEAKVEILITKMEIQGKAMIETLKAELQGINARNAAAEGASEAGSKEPEELTI